MNGKVIRFPVERCNDAGEKGSDSRTEVAQIRESLQPKADDHAEFVERVARETGHSVEALSQLCTLELIQLSAGAAQVRLAARLEAMAPQRGSPGK